MQTPGQAILGAEVSSEDGEDAAAVAKARAELARELERRFRDRNFADSYLARRCRTTDRVVQDWRSGSAVPTHAEWWYLGKVMPDLRDLNSTWKTAAAASMPSQSGQGDNLPAPSPSAGDLVASTPPVPSLAASLPSTPPTHRRAKEASSLPLGNSQDPEECLVFRCRISGGRVVELPLPVRLSRADVERICAFLRTQADPEPDE